MIATAVDVVVKVVRAAHRRQVWLSAAGLVLTLVVGTAYLLIGALRVTPFASSYRVTVQLPESGGLLPSPVPVATAEARRAAGDWDRPGWGSG